MSRFIIHAGLHKTGTTTLQAALAADQGTLAKTGLVLPHDPAADDPSPVTHHRNIAWELTSDRRLRAARGFFDATRRVASEQTGHLLLSAEDFEGLLLSPDGLAPLFELARSTGRTPELAVVLRPQADYVRSLYLQLMKRAGFADIFEAFCRDVLQSGAIRVKESRYVFDYANALRLQSSVGWACRAMGFGRIAGPELPNRFLTELDLPVVRIAQRPKNVSDVHRAWTRFISRRLALPAPARLLADQLSRAWVPSQVTMSHRTLDTIQERFHATNMALATDFGVALEAPTSGGSDALTIEELFSSQAVLAAGDALAKAPQRLSGVLERSARRLPSALREQVQRPSRNWPPPPPWPIRS